MGNTGQVILPNDGQVMSDDDETPQASAPQPAPPQQQQAAPPQAGPPPESWASKAYHGILTGLGGKYDTQFIPTPNGVVQQQVAQTPGQQWKRIISGAITGVGAAAQAGTQGPGGAMRGLGAGITTGYGSRIAEEQNKEKQANTRFEQDQKAAMTSAQTSMLAQQKLNLQWEQSYRKMKASQEEIQAANEFEKVVGSGGPGTRFVAHAADLDSAIKLAKADPSLHDDHAGGFLQYNDHIDPETGKHNGVDAYYVGPNVLDTKIPLETTIRVPVTKDGKATFEEHHFDPDTLSYRDYFNVNNTLLSQQKDQAIIAHTEEETKLMPAKQQAELAASAATARSQNADARQKDAETDYLIKNGELPGKTSSKQEQEAYWGGGGWAGMQKFLYSPEVKEANQAENMYQAFLKAYNDHINGRDDTGAPGMVAFSDHVGAVFGGKNIKMNKQLLQDHFDARSISDDAVVFMQKFTNGDPISPKQWEAFKRTVEQNREIQWDSVARNAAAQQRPMDRIGFPADVGTKYLTPGQGGAAGNKLTINTDNLPTLNALPPGAHLKTGSDGNQYVFNAQNQALGKYAASNVQPK